MAKEILGYIKLQIPAGSANPAPPVGPALGQKGLNIQDFCKQFNDKTKDLEKGAPIPTIITAYKDRSFEIVQVASGYRIQVRSGFDEWLRKLDKQTTSKYSRAFLETLVIIAYKQPVTRGDIEDIRGVTVSTQIIRSLLDREWIKLAGYRDVPGRPALYETTKNFLNDLNLKSINDLPPLPEALPAKEVLDQLEAG